VSGWVCGACGRLVPPGESCAGCGWSARHQTRLAPRAAEVAELESLFEAPSYVRPSSALAAVAPWIPAERAARLARRRARDLSAFDYAAGEVRPEPAEPRRPRCFGCLWGLLSCPEVPRG